ncbi:MAG: FtsH protease activity modulator HflK [Synergistaceae bacterium]|nr:FtsH protease activity modulator HflK [Synergistaceae bacterium]
MILIFAALHSFYTVPLGSQALLFSFGRYLGATEQGLHFKAPWAEVVKFDVQEIRRFEFGEKTETPGSRYIQDESEQKMVTSDSKILLISWVAQWKISDPYQYFITNNVESENNSYRLISGLAEADFRKEVANMKYEEILTTGKVTLSANAKARITNTFKQLGAGLSIVDVLISDVKVPPSVQASYNDVETAKQAKTSAINEAEAYANKTVEEAKGRAQVAVNNSEAYKVNKVADATAVSTRLLSLNEMYVTNPDLVKTNLWYENIDEILSRLNIIFIDGSSGNNIFLGDVPITLNGNN